MRRAGNARNATRQQLGVPRRAWSSAVAVVLAVSGCSDKASGPNPELIQVVGVSAVREVPINSSFVAPDGSAWIYLDDGRLCVGVRAQPEAEPTCGVWDDSVSTNGVSWSSDATRVLFTQEYAIRRDEPDVSVFDVETGQIDVLIDDDVDDIDDDRAEVDVDPFFGPGDEIYFFRHSRPNSAFELYRLADGEAKPVEGGQLVSGWLTAGPPINSGNNTWTFGYSKGRGPAGYVALTFDGSDAGAKVSIEDLWSGGFPAWLSDASGGTLGITSDDFRESKPALAVIPDNRASVELEIDDDIGDDFSAVGLRLSADGHHVLEVRSARNGVAQFTIWRLEPEGDTLTAEPTPVGTVTDQRIGGWVGTVPGTLGWDGNTTLTAIGSGGLIVFDVTLDEK